MPICETAKPYSLSTRKLVNITTPFEDVILYQVNILPKPIEKTTQSNEGYIIQDQKQQSKEIFNYIKSG